MKLIQTSIAVESFKRNRLIPAAPDALGLELLVNCLITVLANIHSLVGSVAWTENVVELSLRHSFSPSVDISDLPIPIQELPLRHL